MATLSVQTQDRTGLNPTTQAAEAGGDDFANDGRTYLYVNNTDGSPHDVQPDAVVQAFGKDVDPDPVTVPAGANGFLIGPFAKEDFGSTASFTYPAGVTGLEVAAVQMAGVTPS